MFYNVLDKRVLHVWRIGHGDLLIAITRLQTDGLIVEDRETHLSLCAYYLDTILAGTLVSHVAPRARARQTILETERCTHGILCIVVSTAIGAYSASLEDYSENILQEVELMGSHIVEITSSGYLRLESPG